VNRRGFDRRCRRRGDARGQRRRGGGGWRRRDDRRSEVGGNPREGERAIVIACVRGAIGRAFDPSNRLGVVTAGPHGLASRERPGDILGIRVDGGREFRDGLHAVHRTVAAASISTRQDFKLGAAGGVVVQGGRAEAHLERS
jgi:hypothetical protein